MIMAIMIHIINDECFYGIFIGRHTQIRAT